MLEEIGINIAMIQGDIWRIPVRELDQFDIDTVLFGFFCCDL